jgi:imidazolonepropionase-like amidohydrolase
MLLIKNGMIHDAITPDPFRADILVKDGKIAKIEADIDAPEAEIFDASGKDIYPGFIDAHTHIGMFGYGGDVTKDDVEKYDRCTPEQRGIDCINPEEPTFRAAAMAGVTCVCVGPGSVGCIAGTHLAMKTRGDRVDDMVVKDPVAMKMAFGENPKRALMDKLTTRMTIAATIRETIMKAKEYDQLKQLANGDISKMPRYDAAMEAMIPVIRKEIPMKAHAHRKDDIFTAIRVAKECDVRLTLEHVSDGGSVAETLAKEGYPIVCGPYLYQTKKTENFNGHPSAAVKLVKAGCQVSVMTDSPIVAEEYLPLVAGLLMREGLDEFEALKTITINPAKHLGIEDRVGSIEVGKDADLVIAKGCPMDMRVKAETVFIEGKPLTVNMTGEEA